MGLLQKNHCNSPVFLQTDRMCNEISGKTNPGWFVGLCNEPFMRIYLKYSFISCMRSLCLTPKGQRASQ